jgi:hypothetical protein
MTKIITLFCDNYNTKSINYFCANLEFFARKIELC